MPGNVLVVDDDASFRIIARGMLESGGYRVYEAATAAAALEGARTSPLNVVLVDLAMPGIDRTELIRRLREQPMPPPVLAVSDVWREEPPELRGVRDDVFGYLPKPFTYGQLIEACEHAVSAAEEARLDVSRVIERRRDRRRDLFLPAVVLSPKGAPIAQCPILNLSPGGAELELGAALQLGCEFRLAFEIPGGQGAFDLSAYVRWSRPPRLGVSFVRLAEEDRSRLEPLFGSTG